MVSLQIRTQESSEQVASRLGSEGCQLTQFTSDEWACNQAYTDVSDNCWILLYLITVAHLQDNTLVYNINLPLKCGSRLCGLERASQCDWTYVCNKSVVIVQVHMLPGRAYTKNLYRVSQGTSM